jgi:hypothetical protein
MVDLSEDPHIDMILQGLNSPAPQAFYVIELHHSNQRYENAFI